jgi:hypothetical protein
MDFRRRFESARLKAALPSIEVVWLDPRRDSRAL